MAGAYDFPAAFPSMPAMPISALQPPQGMSLPPTPVRPPDLSKVTTDQLSPFGHLGDTLNQLVVNKQQQQQSNGLIGQLLSQRFQPSDQDIGTSLMRTATENKYISPNEVASDNVMTQLAPYTAMAKLQNAGVEANGGATGALVSRLMSENPSMFPSAADALYFLKGGANQGLTSSNGQITAMPGAGPAKGSIKYAEKSGEQNAILGTAADIERQKKIGAGEITDVDKQNKGKSQVSEMVNNLSASYDALDKLGGAVNTDKSGAANLGASFANSPAGQQIGKTFGTKTQSARNQIEQSRPLLINAIRQATGMSAKAMDSNTELQFYLKAASDPALDIQANKYALKRLDELYGLGGGQSSGGAAPDNLGVPTGGSSGGFDINSYLREKGLQ